MELEITFADNKFSVARYGEECDCGNDDGQPFELAEIIIPSYDHGYRKQEDR